METRQATLVLLLMSNMDTNLFPSDFAARFCFASVQRDTRVLAELFPVLLNDALSTVLLKNLAVKPR